MDCSLPDFSVHGILQARIAVVQSFSCVWVCDPMDCSMPGFPVLHHLPELAQIHVGSVMPSNHLILSHPLLLLPPPPVSRKNPGVVCHALFWEMFPNQGWKLQLLCFPSLAGKFSTTNAAWEASMVLVLLMLSFKPAFSPSSFILIRRVFVPLCFLPLGWCHLHIWGCWYFSQQSSFQVSLSSLAFWIMYSAYKLNKQSENTQPWCTPFPLLNQSIASRRILLLLDLHTGFSGDE